MAVVFMEIYESNEDKIENDLFEPLLLMEDNNLVYYMNVLFSALNRIVEGMKPSEGRTMMVILWRAI